MDFFSKSAAKVRFFDEKQYICSRKLRNSMKKIFKAALFDLDGVVLDTESQYSCFWGGIGREYHANIPDFADRIKGQTLTQIYDGWFAGQESLQQAITCRLNEFEASMHFPYINGARAYIEQLQREGIKMAIVTSSNQAKMRSAYGEHPELHQLFDRILTSEDFAASKPAPDCYLLGAQVFGVEPSECVVFEDSINGLRAGRDSGAYVVGLSTTNPAEVIRPLADLVVSDFTSPDLSRLTC